MIYASPQEILDAVSEHFGVALSALLGKRRSQSVVNARHCAMALLRQRGMSYPEIGQALGGKDHVTAMGGVRRASNNPTLTAHVEHLRASLEGKAA